MRSTHPQQNLGFLPIIPTEQQRERLGGADLDKGCFAFASHLATNLTTVCFFIPPDLLFFLSITM
jgi:hypothetical protein